MDSRILDTVTHAYLEAAVFTDFGPDSDIPSDTEWAPQAIQQARKVCTAFLESHGELSNAYIQAGRTWDSFGHDLWFTRNGHGVGFWDRGLGELGDKLTDKAHELGEVWTEHGDDGFAYFVG